MPQVKANGITLEYESFGPQDRETILLIMGLGAQLTMWPTELCDELVKRGYRVIRYDNRDVGLSHKFDEHGMPDMAAIFGALMAGQPAQSPYSLDDMAADAVGLLDALGVKQAHIAGASMGGMIAQLVAANHPERTLSLTSIMSTTGNPEVPQGKPEAMAVLMTPAPEGDIPAAIERGILAWNTIGSPGYRTDDETLRQWVTRDVNRSLYPVGTARQMAAIVANGDRREKLKNIKVPAVVLHGVDDPLVPVEGGRDTAKSIPGAELREVPGMGHDFPLALVDTFADAIEAAAKRAAKAQAAE
ncbi:MAG: alpha/beta hydrolase [Parvibaculum sp.]|jgi:pimeloyl-ACP methyl ester carboxylesterase|uniref:alpha/beta fold hydrolase n=1 Tax=Parvibaculum sp. TaxID=2024848 RepID=UPI000C448EF9|nr:alpha/beta hydrolase [Parvibaculum sp.]MAU60811.1 alpha/beta hydrolase [Parvibaculum sp.]HAC59827.1 alpha/beta hydrolase [Rhodobiaceae bacterium]|tara:strand:+ start:1349 stop:2254 length:906 start_codon:yes stop_codon:yes gene_type:complete